MPPTMDYAATGATLLDSLRNLRRRVKLLTVAYGAGIVLASAVGLILAVVLLDYILQLPAGPRAAVNLAALAVLGYAAWVRLVRPALASITLSDLAGRIENTFPQFDDTLRSTVVFTEAKDVPGSEVMKFRTVERATEVAKQVDLSQAVALKPVWGSIAVGLGALAAFILIAAFVDPNLRKIAADRLFAGDAVWPKTVEISMIDFPSQRIAAGGDVKISMKLAKGDVKQATIKYRYDNGAWQQEIVRADANGVFATTLKAQLDTNRDLAKLQIAIEAGDDEKTLPGVTVVPQLEIRQAVATVTPPAYSKLPPSQVNLAERPVVAAVGATVDLGITFNKPLDTAKGIRIVPSDSARQAPPVEWTFPRNGQASGRFNLTTGFKTEDSFRFTLRATDTDGFENQSALEYQITVHEDAKPMVVIDEPRQSEDRTPNATVPLRISADDDYGFDSVDLVVEGKGPALASRQPWIIPLVREGVAQAGVDWQLSPNSTVERKRFTAGFGWELDKLAGVTLKPGDKLEFFVRVRDNFDLAGQRHDPVDSSRLTITIISHDQFEAWMEERISTVRQELSGIKKTQDVLKSTTDEQSKETKERGKLDDAQKATMSRLANQQATAASQTKQSSQKLADLVKRATENKASEEGPKKAANEVAKQLDRTAEAPMKEATSKLNEAKDTKSDPKGSPQQQKQSAEQASQSLDQASQQQKNASEQLDQAMAKLNEFSGLRPAIEKLEDIKKKQDAVAKEYKEKLKDALGKKPEDMTTDQKKDAKELADRQAELSKETEKAIKDMEAKADKMEASKSDPAAAKAMKESAQAGKSQSVPQKQSNPQEDDGASQQMQKNQQANAQQKHKEIELGLDMMIEKLKAAERAKLEELQKQLAEMQDLLKALVARQSGHNIDNLLLQDPSAKKITDMTEADRVKLFEDARRDIAKLAELKPDLPVLTPSQEQTHRNTKDVAQKAQSLPDTAPAGKIFSAATKMEQAIVFLRQTKLTDAYQPPQVEALKNLLDALKLVDEAKKKADDQADQAKEESIKQAYVKILEKQKKIDAETLDLDKNGRDEEGNLKRSAAVRLSPDGLPKEQGELSTEAKKLGEQLASIKSIVYVWANKDIVNSMNEVKGDLAKPQTDVIVQTQQKRIEEQLEAMIKNLAQKPPEKKEFADRSGGGGGGGGGKPPPKMPTDVELRLLQDLQLAVNKATTIIDAAVKAAGGKKDAEKVTSLGGRQGELRNLLDTLIKAASQDKIALAPEPKDTEKLPEEASAQDIEDQEFMKELMENKVTADTVEKTIKLIGDRMGRSRQRLALDNDPGKTTQEIQKRIIMDLDNLIKLAQQQQQGGGKPQPGKPGDKPGEPQPGQGEGPQQAGKPGQQPGQQTGGTTAAGESSLSQGGAPNEDLSKELKEKMMEWGIITGRDRGAVMDSAGETTAEKYRKYVEDYYRELGKKATER
ncbi:DUF4175 family protein [Humisphaera borealis]|uniref:DUF4175 family protein n=1 Tax=Humisphaera borealis TaxID=2807512 RepID=A0A7M2WWS4_9BACT|nr:DUF4175 family protein [Humisphaera borealis]QOV89945.1 hypothetical protein IPV69_00805 [Humisphaera borealis]